MNEKEKMSKLIDVYGFSYARAQKVLENADPDFIFSCIEIAYKNGKKEHVNSWEGTSYG